MDIDGRKVVVARSRARVVIASPVKNGRLSQKAKMFSMRKIGEAASGGVRNTKNLVWKKLNRCDVNENVSV